MPERLYTAYQIADLLGATPAEVSGWMRSGELPFKRYPDGPVRISERGLIHFLKRRGIDIETIMAKAVLREAEAGGRDEPQSVIVEEPQPPRLDRRRAGRQERKEPGEEAVSLPLPGPHLLESQPEPAGDPAGQVAEAIVKDALARRATHIHLEPGGDGLALRLRVDGVLREKPHFTARLPRDLAPALLKRFKELAGADVAQTHRPQSGSFTRTVEGRQVLLHLSTFPAARGEKLLIRLADGQWEMPELSRLGLAPREEAKLRRLACQRCGVIVLAGPPHSGKAATLRALVAGMSVRERSVVAVADSADWEIEGVLHAHVNPAAGFTFAEAVRALAGQDPDVIVVRGLRDAATARAVVEAAAGRLVLATMRAHSTAAAVESLLAMGGDPWALSESLLAVIEQRIVRALCQECRSRSEPPQELLAELALRAEEIGAVAYAPGGCERCSQTGYSGTAGLFSILEVDDAMAALLRDGPDARAIERAAAQRRIVTLREAALRKVRAGTTSLQEIARVLGGGS